VLDTSALDREAAIGAAVEIVLGGVDKLAHPQTD